MLYEKIVADITIYFASHVDSAIIGCFFEYHVTGVSPMYKIKLDIVFGSLVSPPPLHNHYLNGRENNGL